MEKNYFVNACSFIKTMAKSNVATQTKQEKEVQTLFFKVMKSFEKEIEIDYFSKTKSDCYCVEISTKHNESREKVVRYKNNFIAFSEFEEVIKKVADIYNGVEGFSAEYFNVGAEGEYILKVTLNN